MFDVAIGLEIHAELKTKTKVFCACKNEFGAKPNTNVCPVCTGMPGSLPLINKHAVELCIKAGLCFGSTINEYAVMERKNYFYPDLPKAYQISQYKNPICIGGGITLDNGKFKALNRIHLEEDAGKLVHVSKEMGTLVDYNRCGAPLIEIVTEPVFSSAEEVVEFVKKVRENLIFAGVSDCKMQEGGLRCDLNISLKKKGSKNFGTRTEMKNLNSLKNVSLAINFEIERQKNILLAGGEVVKETRRWDESLCENFSMRSKEDAQDYRYFPDPDILPMKILRSDVLAIQKEIPVLPQIRREKYKNVFMLSDTEAELLTSDKYISDYFDNCVKLYDNPKKIANWILTEMLRKLKETNSNVFCVNEKDLTDIIKLVEHKKITKTSGVTLLDKLAKSKKSALVLAEEMGLVSKITEKEIVEILQKFKNENPQVVQDYKTDERILQFIIGYVMKCTDGKANGQLVTETIKKFFD